MAIHVGIGLSTERDPVKAAKEAVQQAKIDIHNERINLALVFSSIDFVHGGAIRIISSLLGPVAIVGCSTAAIISSQGVFEHGLILMLLSLPQSIFFNTAYVKEIKTKAALLAGQELGEKLLHGLKEVHRNATLLFCDGLMPEVSNLIYGLQERLGRSSPLVGASSSDNIHFLKTYQYFNQEVFSDAVVGILWGGKLNFGLGVKHGWKPLGKPRYITKSNGNIVYEIDGAPATKVYEEYLAGDLLKLRKELKRISILYPIGIYLPGEEEYLLRNILSIEDNGSLVFQGNVPQDSQIRLMIGTKESCLSATQQALDEAKMGIPHPNFLLVFDSISRYILLGRDAIKELEIIKQGLPDKNTPIVGLYTYGEQAPLRAINYQGRAYFHNQTITILGLGD